MSKSTISDSWFVRVDGNEEFLRTKLTELQNCIDTQLIHALFHLGSKKDNTHTHFVIKTSSSQKQSFAVRIKKLFNIIKRTDYSIELWDGVIDGGAVSYMYHEELAQVLASKSVTQEQIQRAIVLNQEVQKVVSINKMKAGTKLVEKALNHYDGDYVPEREDILLFMLKEIHSGNSYHPGEFRLKSFVEEVQIKKSNADELKEYAYQLALRLWRP